MKKLKTLLTDNLKNKDSFKTIVVDGQEVKVTKVGLRHLNHIKNLDPEDPKAVEKYANLFMPNCSWAQGELVLFHVEHFNRKLPQEIEYMGNIFNADDVKISSKTTFVYDDVLYEFKPLYFFEMFQSDSDMLTEKYKKGPVVDDWKKMPAFVNTWANKIRNTVTIRGSNGLVINGGDNILEVFIGNDKQ